jgi:hypothetical protein
MDGRVSIPDRGKNLSVFQSFQTGFGNHPASYPMGRARDPFRRSVKLTAQLYVVATLDRVLRGSVELPLAGVHFFPMRTNTCLSSWGRSARRQMEALRCHAGYGLKNGGSIPPLHHNPYVVVLN